MDWQGLLKWSIGQSDGLPKDIKPMDKETQQWLQDAFEHYSYDEVRRMGELVKQFLEPELQTEIDEQNRIKLLDELDEITSGFDRGRDFCTIGGMSALLKYMDETNYQEVLFLALRIFTGINQNNTQVQEYCAEHNAFKLLDMVQSNQFQLKVREQMVSAISSLVRGENLSNKRIFIDRNGIQIMFSLLQELSNSNRIKEKIINLIKDLILYDHNLHLTHHDVSKFSNTNSETLKIDKEKKIKTKQNDDINDQLKTQNEIPENKKYQNIVKQILPQFGMTNINFANSILNNLEDRNLDMRISYLQILDQLFQNNPNIHTSELNDSLKSHLILVLKKNKLDDNYNIIEFECIQSILSKFKAMKQI